MFIRNRNFERSLLFFFVLGIFILSVCSSPNSDRTKKDYGLSEKSQNAKHKETVLDSGVSVLRFKKAEMGDYIHWIFTDAKSRENSFYVSAKIDVDKMKMEKRKGQKCRVHWRKLRMFIPEGGGYYTVRRIYRIKCLG